MRVGGMDFIGLKSKHFKNKIAVTNYSYNKWGANKLRTVMSQIESLMICKYMRERERETKTMLSEPLVTAA
jgi:hypothetical protein